MHEYALVEALIRAVEREARARDAVAVRRVSVRLGEAAGVERALFETAFATFRDGTICAGAELAVVPVPARWVCGACGRAPGESSSLACACGGRARLAEGDELVLDRVELEVPS